MKKHLTKILAALTGLVIALALGEVGLRLLGIGYPDFFDYDPRLGSRLRPGIKGYFHKEGGGYVRINADGLRDRDHALNPAPNTLRIAVLGDSFAEAMQVDQEEAFWAVMEKDLQACASLKGRQAEVINFGQAGFGTAQELLALRHRVWKYAPDVVLLAFFTGNDVTDNHPALMQYDYNPYFTFQDGKLVLNDRHTREKWEQEQENKSWGGEFRRWRRDTFRVAQVVQQFQKVIKVWWAQAWRSGEAEAAFPGSEPGLNDTIYREPVSPVWQEAWKITEALLLVMRDEVAANGARFFVVVLTNGAQVHPDPQVRAQYARRLGTEDIFYPDRRLQAFCAREDIPILLLAPAFQEYATAHNVYLHGFNSGLGGGHWNQHGHRLAGNLMARWLCGQLQ